MIMHPKWVIEQHTYTGYLQVDEAKERALHCLQHVALGQARSQYTAQFIVTLILVHVSYPSLHAHTQILLLLTSGGFNLKYPTIDGRIDPMCVKFCNKVHQ
jgi:hypothetical protein